MRSPVRSWTVCVGSSMLSTSPTTSCDAIVEQRSLGPLTAFDGCSLPERDVHEAGLVDVLAYAGR